MKDILAKTTLSTAALLLMAGTALAQPSVSATATVDLNVRSGPGPQYQAVGVIPSGTSATVQGCLEQSQWCEVSFEGGSGWAYSDYLTIDSGGSTVVLTQRPAEAVPIARVPETSTTANSTVTGAAGGAIAGALIGGPVGAAIGGALGATAGVVVDPPAPAIDYVRNNPLDPIYLEGEVVVGAQVPDTVTVTPIPDYQYSYVYVNGFPVLVEPQSREIVYVVR